jgi:hypothetical protein
MNCKGCNCRDVISGISGGWFLRPNLLDWSIQIAYCPYCGTLLDPACAKTLRRLKAQHAKKKAKR